MEERIIRFIAALRAAGVRISLAESSDAFRAVDNLGIKDRETFRLSLQSTLVKDASSLPAFEELFPIFFSSYDSPPMADLSQDLTPEDAEMLAQALRKFNQDLRRMLEKLLKGEQLSQEELERLGKLVGLNHSSEMRQRDWMVQRMKRALRFKEIQEALQELSELLTQMGMNKEKINQIQNLLGANQQALEQQLQQFAGQRIAENLSKHPAEENIEGLMNKSFSSLSDRDMDRLRKEVQRLAAVLRTRIALRQKRAKNGQLDAKATLRANLKHGAVPLELKHRQHDLKPKMVVICDVSTSMRFCSELMLSLIYALQDLINKTSAFAFIDHLEYISPDFAGREVREAVRQVLDRLPPGYYNTDLGSSLEDFSRDHLDTLDSRTIFLVVGDGRNNYNEPRVDLFNMIGRRSRRTIWLNPEAPVLWGTGDSDMLKYAPKCDIVLHASTLVELSAAVDNLLQA
jgi:uncharacterized protein with von Willebrand factor type A (vWA) domain